MMLFISIYILTILHTTLTSQVESDGTMEWRLLNDGNRMPAAAFGTYMVDLNDRQYMTQAVIWAIEAGYRHIDTAVLYASEDKIGDAIENVTKRCIVKREELFVSTKLPFRAATRKQIVPAVRNSLKRLKLDYVDLYLIHTPRNFLDIKNRDYLEMWKGLEDAKKMGLTRSIGISNFNATEVNRILVNSKTVPAVNQIETNPTYTELELVAYCQSQNILVTGYAPFGFLVYRSFNDLSIPPTFDDPILVGLAQKYGVKVNQIVLRYLLERSVVPIAASLNKEHIESNIDIFNFTISQEDVRRINQFDRNVKVYPIDDDGSEQNLWRNGYSTWKKYVEENDLEQYKNAL